MTGHVELKLNTRQIKGAARKGAARGLKLAAEHVLAESVKVVPIEEGTLQHSGKATVDEADLRAAVSYDTPYAVVQHEDTNLRHDAGRKAKYLEEPMNAQRSTAGRIIAREIRGDLQS